MRGLPVLGLVRVQVQVQTRGLVVDRVDRVDLADLVAQSQEVLVALAVAGQALVGLPVQALGLVALQGQPSRVQAVPLQRHVAVWYEPQGLPRLTLNLVAVLVAAPAKVAAEARAVVAPVVQARALLQGHHRRCQGLRRASKIIPQVKLVMQPGQGVPLWRNTPKSRTKKPA